MNKLKNINHWINHVRILARKIKVRNEGEKKQMPAGQFKKVFSKDNFMKRFKEGITPQQAFDNEMEFWADAT